jgi:pimeloyl-ACP methyl ester carboxylesterase
MGGYVAQQMLADAPRRVAALALVDTSTRPEPAENIPVREALIAGLQNDFGATALTLLRRGVHADRLSDVMLLLGCQQIMRDVGADAAIGQIRAIIGRADHRALLAQLDLPVLVLCGRVDQITPLALSREAAALIPGARLHIFEDVGHWAPLERPEEVAAQLGRLLDRV